MSTPQPGAEAMAAAEAMDNHSLLEDDVSWTEAARLIDEAYAGVRREHEQALALLGANRMTIDDLRRERDEALACVSRFLNDPPAMMMVGGALRPINADGMRDLADRLEALRREREALREGLRELTSAELVSCDSNPSADAGDKENGACMTCYACKQLAKARALLAGGGGK